MLTVVYADLIGSTALQEELDPELARRVMTSFYECIREVIGTHGGNVQRFIGDAVVAAFGIPELREDDALRAVRAAAAMVNSLGELNKELEERWGISLRMRTAVNTGELVVSEDGILVGDVMNTAARLEQAGSDGEVLLGEATWRLVRHAVELEPLAPLELKGKADQVRAWRLVSVAEARHRGTPSDEAALVDRTDALACLRSAFDEVVKARACALITVMGSPGVGKSRLVREFGRVIRDQANVVEGRCVQTGAGITFLPVAEVLRAVGRIGEADPLEIVRQKLSSLIASNEPERERILEAVSAVLGFGEPASAEETFWGLRRGLESVARVRPLVLVLEDLHWGQPMLLDLVEHLVEWVRDTPVLIVAVARPDLRDLRETLTFTGRRVRDVIELEVLDRDDSRELVGELFGDVRVPSALSTRILETAEGNPLFLGETVRMLIDEGLLQRQGDSWVADDGPATISVPPTIQALLAARIECLSRDERSVVERAAVIGKQFYRGAVAELVAPPVRSKIDAHLEALRRKDMVEPEGLYWVDEPVYRFHHVLIRDAAYRSLLKEGRADLHERFAEWLERKAGDLVGEHEEVIAFHLEQAHEYQRQLGLAGEHERALGSRAAERLHSAGRRALAREDLAAATNLLGRAMARDSGNQPEILWDLCEATLCAGDVAAAEKFISQLTELSGEDQLISARVRVLEGQLGNLTGRGHTSGTANALEASAKTLGELGDQTGEAKGYHVAAGGYGRLGRVAAVEDALDRALAASRTAKDRRRTTAVLAAAPRAALWGPSSVVAASGRCLDVVRILRMTPGSRHVEPIALRCQAVLEAMRGRFDAARKMLAAGQMTLEEFGLELELHETQVHAGIVDLLANDPKSAAERLRSARDGFEGLGVMAGAAEAAALLARALVECGSGEEAAEQSRLAEQRAGDDLKTTITWCSARGEALAQLGEVDAALTFARRAVALAEPTDALVDKADAFMALAKVLLAVGAHDAASAARAAVECYEAKGHTVGVERATRLAGEARSVTVPASATGGEKFGAERMLSGAAVLGDRPPELFCDELMRRVARRDIEPVLALYVEDCVMADRRRLESDPQQGHDALRRHYESLFVASPHVRGEIDRVLACDDRVIATRLAFRGPETHADELFGCVTVIENGRGVSVDYYDYDDDAAMVRRYHELGGYPLAFADRPPERLVAATYRHVAAGDLKRIGELHAEDAVILDNRALPWEDARGRSAIERLYESGLTAFPDLWLDVVEVLACDARVMALRYKLRGHGTDGGGEIEVPQGSVVRVEDGQLASVELYDIDNRPAMLARYEELGGSYEPGGNRA